MEGRCPATRATRRGIATGQTGFCLPRGEGASDVEGCTNCAVGWISIPHQLIEMEVKISRLEVSQSAGIDRSVYWK